MAAPDHISSLLNVRTDSLRPEFEFQLFIKKYMVKLGELYTIYGKILSKMTAVRSPISCSLFVCKEVVTIFSFKRWGVSVPSP